MKICIVGGGKIGFYLAKSMLEHGHDPVVIEMSERGCEHLANTLDIHVISGDGTTPEVLAAAGCASCSSLIAVTGNDETNLIACQIAKRVFGLPKTVARVNNPKNAPILRQLGVDIAVSSTDNLGRILEREVETDAIRQVLSLAGGTASLTEITIPKGFKYDGQRLSEIKMPTNAIIISLTRNGDFIIPRGKTRLFAGDLVLCMANDEVFHTLTVDWGL